MADIKEKISSSFPNAVVEQLDTLTITVAPAELHELAKSLRDDEDLKFDFLITIVGMDWVESLGCIYYLTSTASNEVIAIKTSTDNIDQPTIPSLADLWDDAITFEREIYDFFGIIFLGNPDMRRLSLA